MTWVFNERPTSRKFTFSDDGAAKASIQLVATTPAAGEDETVAALDKKSAPRSLFHDLYEAGWGIGQKAQGFSASNAATPFDLGSDGYEWMVESFSGAQPANANGDVWYIDVALSWVGYAANWGDDVAGDYNNIRGDITVMFGSQQRAASTYKDWFLLGEPEGEDDAEPLINIPDYGDVDWGSVSGGTTDVLCDGVAVDVSGRPIVQMLPGVRLTINILQEFQTWHVRNLSEIVGFRNDSEFFGFERGKVLFESCEMVQVGHGFMRATLRFYVDHFYHLQQEAATLGFSNSPNFEDTATTVVVTDVCEVFHAYSVWRQPYPLTTHDKSFSIGTFFSLDQASYISAILSEPTP
tara:strand:+ start:210 stop:1265 length:1056 start_codon:yes stop_codon:yes gene_type:complete